MNYKLPFLNVIAASVYFAWTNKSEFLKAISVPTLALVVVGGVWLLLSDDIPAYFSWVMLLAYGLGFSFLAVSCHRLILMDAADRYKSFNARPGYRELRFLAWVIVIYTIKSVVGGIVYILVVYLGGSVFAEQSGVVSEWIKQIALLPALYVLARLSLAFPATAIDKRSGLNWSWARTRGNGWRLFVVVGLFPWLVSTMFWFVWREEATVLEQVVLSILTYIGLSIEIIALSFAYKELEKHYVPDRQVIAGEIKSALADASSGSFHELAPESTSSKTFIMVKVVVSLAIGYVIIGSLASHYIDCESERISRALSPGSLYEAELLNTTCKDDKKREGLFLEIAKTTTPKTISRYTISKTVSKEADLVWTSDKHLVIRHAKSLELASMPAMFDDVQIDFENKSDSD